MDDFFSQFNLMATIKQYEMTRMAARNVSNVMGDRNFPEMDEEMIYKYLEQQKDQYSFGKYLKRYIYIQWGESESGDYLSVDSAEYVDSIIDTYQSNCCPPPSRQELNKWLKRKTVERDTIFSLGMGLGMKPEEVTQFLTHVQDGRDDDYDFFNTDEVIYWYCAEKGLGNPEVEALKEFVAGVDPNDVKIDEKQWKAMQENPQLYFRMGKHEEYLKKYLTYLKATGQKSEREQTAHKLFCQLLDEVRQLISKPHDDASETVSNLEIERQLYSGVPINDMGNLQKLMKELKEQIGSSRLNRKHISDLEKGKSRVRRFDLLTILFLKNAVDTNLEEGLNRFINEAYDILSRCGLAMLYPADPYDMLLLMCMNSPYDPLCTFNDVMGRYYGEIEKFEEIDTTVPIDHDAMMDC